MQFSDLDVDGSYTYADYLKWNFEERLELINGKIFRMGPSPSPAHQDISNNINYGIRKYLEGKSGCKVYYAPFDVRFPRTLPDDKEVVTVLQPDLCVICDPSKIDNRGCLGAPDIVVEILSPSNSKKEMKNKYQVYEEGGVKEYWVVFPTERLVFIYILTNGKYKALPPKTEDDAITSQVLQGFRLDISDIFGLMKAEDE